MRYLYDLTLAELISTVEQAAEPKYRAHQIWQGIYKKFWSSWEQFSSLPASFRSCLSESLQIQALNPISTIQSTDGQTIKTLFQLNDGAAIESVLMRYEKRNSLCISTQVGCAMGCVFCATGQMGFKRNLSSGEIVAQVMYYAQQLVEQGESVTNVVVMGMGEPFHNYENTMMAIDRLNDPDGYHFGTRRFTISTVGLIPAIVRFTNEKCQVNLAISLHAADDELRSSLLPINKRYPIKELLEACRNYVAITGRRITFEWALVRNINDTPEQAYLLAKKLKGLLCHVNAIPLNPTHGYDGLATSPYRANEFKAILESSGIPCTIRIRRGIEIGAGCGQLVVDY